METIIVEIAKYTYIDKLFICLGFNEGLSSLFALIITSCLIYLLIKWGKLFFLRCKTRKILRDLAPYYEKYRVKRATEYFISTNGQNISPTKEEEPAIGNKFITREKLIPFFINNVFRGKKESDKFYLILADSGMGKTTFLINLYIKYNSIFNFKSKHNIKILPFGEKDIIQRIKEIANNQNKAKDTILLLDAFDEYKGLLSPENPDGLTDDERFRKQLDEIFDITRDFRNVIISSRTQYFPAQEENPYELNIPCFGKEGFYKLSKLYLSPFDEKDIKKYLNKKFGIFKIWNLKKKRKAKKITGDSHKLMVRPMLLSYIDYLVDDDSNYEKTVDIYDILIKKWIDREGVKRKYDSVSRDKFKSDLLQFSKLVAIEIYKSGEYSKGISKNIAQEICEKHNLNLEGYEITGQSLLTRDVATNWKFAHKSIYEFFIAEAAIENIHFGLYVDITSIDMAKRFIYEKNGRSSLHLYNYFPIAGKKNYYMSGVVVSRKDFNLIMDNMVEEISSFRRNTFSKSESISYCNQLNEKFGYKIHYGHDGILRDENNKDLTHSKVKGFVFQTMDEFASSLKNGYFFHAYTGADASIVLTRYSDDICKEMLFIKDKDMNVKLDFTVVRKEEIPRTFPEWTIEELFIRSDNILKIKDFPKEKVTGFEDKKFLRLVYVGN